MTLLLIIIVIAVLFGGGGYYGTTAGWYGNGGFSGIGIVGLLLIIAVVWLLAGR